MQPDIIVTSSKTVTAALQEETPAIPIVFVNVSDPVVSGIVAALNQPGGNITGFGYLEPSMGGKWLEPLSEITPGSSGPRSCSIPTPPLYRFICLHAAARSLKVVPDDVEIETAIIGLGRQPLSGLVVMPDTFTVVHRVPIILVAARNNNRRSIRDLTMLETAVCSPTQSTR